MISQRTILSLAQFLELQEHHRLALLFDKHGVPHKLLDTREDLLLTLRGILEATPPDRLLGMLREIAETQRDLRRTGDDWRASGAYEARWRDLERCTLLDGYQISDGQFIRLEPELPGAAAASEDALTRALRQSNLPKASGVLQALVDSAEDFRNGKHSGCLTNARTALETLAKDILEKRTGTNPAKFGTVIADLVKAKVLTPKNDEDGLTGVFGFLSRGAHEAGLRDEEMARLGRGLAVSMCFFLLKKHGGTR